jgi:hypothetical protein
MDNSIFQISTVSAYHQTIFALFTSAKQHTATATTNTSVVVSYNVGPFSSPAPFDRLRSSLQRFASSTIFLWLLSNLSLQ